MGGGADTWYFVAAVIQDSSRSCRYARRVEGDITRRGDELEAEGVVLVSTGGSL
jgi:hypothetical protein